MATYQVLIVDNQRKQRQTLRVGIESLAANLKVHEASSGEEALLLMSQPVDLLVSEYHLAGMTGLELLQKARQRQPQLKAILVADGRQSQVRELALEAGAQACFLKPLSLGEFQAVIRQVLGLEIEAAVEPELFDLRGQLERLCREMDALAVLLLDEKGAILAQAGELPTILAGSAFVTALAQLLRGAAQLAQAVDRQPSEGLLFIPGRQFDLYLGLVGSARGLLVLAHAKAGIQQRDLVLHGLMAAGHALAQDLSLAPEIQQPTAELAPTPAKRQTDGLATGRLGALLSQAPQLNLPAEEIDRFWESAAEQVFHNSSVQAGSLSYEQARQLGLTPAEEKAE